MSLVISDDLLRDAGLTAEQAQVEIACRLYEAGKLSLLGGARWAGLGRGEFESELLRRNLPLCRPTVEDLLADLDALCGLGV